MPTEAQERRRGSGHLSLTLRVSMELATRLTRGVELLQDSLSGTGEISGGDFENAQAPRRTLQVAGEPNAFRDDLLSLIDNAAFLKLLDEVGACRSRGGHGYFD